MIGSFRLVLAVFVVISHTKGYPFERLPDPALSAIVAFFFLSGFLMPATLSGNYAGETYAGQSSRYVLNRLLRIYPIYIFALLLDFAVLALNEQARSIYYFDVKNVLQNFLLLGLNQAELWRQDQRFIGPAWTLDVELQYYLVVPLIVLAARFAPRANAAALLAIAICGVYLLVNPVGRDSVDRSLLPWFPFFAAGFLGFWYSATLKRTLQLNYIRNTGIALCVVSAVFAFIRPALSHWTFAVALIIIALWILLAERKQSKLDVFFGNLSYPIFILHAVVNTSGIPGWITSLVNPGSVPVLTLATLVLTVPLSIVTELFISEPIDRLRKRLRRSQHDGAIVPTPNHLMHSDQRLPGQPSNLFR